MTAALLQTYCSNTARLYPDNDAVILGSDRLTYAALEQLSNQLARAIRAAGAVGGDRIAMLLPKSPRTIAAILGILKADCAYVPVDPHSPALRALKILESAEPKILLVDPVGNPLWQELSGMSGNVPQTPVLWLDSATTAPSGVRQAMDTEGLSEYSSEPLEYQNTGSDPAYVLYTSGSTGMPKGVVITHANVRRFIEWAQGYFGLEHGDRISGHPPLHFDLSVFDVFGSFAAGAQLHLVPPDLNVSASGLAELMRGCRLTQWFSVPSLLTYMAKFDVVRFNDFPALRRLLWCGEVLPTPVLRYWMERLPHVSFTNLYGPTEATIASSYFTVPSLPNAVDAIPIGKACDGEQLLVLDDQLRPVAPSQVGTLYIRGEGLSPGYWKDPQKTNTVFIPNPFTNDPADRIYNTGDLARLDENGLVYFVGRNDSQIKSRGYRIELGEIEAAVHGIDGIKEAAVVAVQNSSLENNLICCAYSLSSAMDLTPAALKKELQRKLPSHMLPARWIVSEKLPKNMNGKVDRSLLKEWFRGKQHDASSQC